MMAPCRITTGHMPLPLPTLKAKPFLIARVVVAGDRDVYGVVGTMIVDETTGEAQFQLPTLQLLENKC